MRFQPAREMALRQVGQFVREYRGVLGFSLRMKEQSAIDPNDAPRRGKGIQLRAVEQYEFQATIL